VYLLHDELANQVILRFGKPLVYQVADVIEEFPNYWEGALSAVAREAYRRTR
jgi:hypothetical protein